MSVAPSRRPLRLGHRGARKHAPENTIAAFDLALEHGCDGFEFDVRFTNDARSIICHDPKLGGLAVASSHYDAICDAAGCEVPCLDDVLARYGDRAYLDIEVKVAGAEPDIVRAVRAHSPAGGFVVSSFLPEVLTALRKLDAQLPLGFISERRDHLAAAEDFDVQAVMPHASVLDAGMIERWHARGRQVLVWTVNRRDDMLRFADMGVDAVIADDTALLGSLWR